MEATLIEDLKNDYTELSDEIKEHFDEVLNHAKEVLDEARKKKPPFVVSWTKIQRQRRRGGLTTRLLRAQMLKQRRRYRGRTGRRGFFLRMRPKLLRNLRKAMRAGARVRAVRHRKWTMRRAGHILKRMAKVGGVEKFTGRARYRRKRGKRTTQTRGRTRSIAAYRRQRVASGVFYGIAPLLSEMFITDCVRGDVDRNDLLTFLAIESETIESPVFPIAFKVASFIEESDVGEKFFDVDIVDDIIYVMFDELDEKEFDKAKKILDGVGENELIVRHGDHIDEVTIADFTVFGIAPSEEFSKPLIEEIIGDEADFLKECERDDDVDDYTLLLIIEKLVEEGVFDDDDGQTFDEEEIDEHEYDASDEEDVKDDFIDEKILNLIDDLKDNAGFETTNVDEKLWSAKVTKEAKWSPPKGLFAKGSASEIATTLKNASSSLKQAMSRLNFFINRADPKEVRLSVLNSAKAKLRALYDKGLKKKID